MKLPRQVPGLYKVCSVKKLAAVRNIVTSIYGLRTAFYTKYNFELPENSNSIFKNNLQGRHFNKDKKEIG
jgi:hypothetical protein